MSDVNTNFFQAMDERIMTVLGHAVAGKATEYATLLETVTGIFIALYVLWCGYMVFAGKLQRPVESIIWEIESALLWVGIIFALVISALVFLIAEISILLLTTTAPVFIFCLMFGFLRTMFNNWLQAIFSSIITVMFGSLVLSGGLKYLNHVLTVIDKQAIDNNIMGHLEKPQIR